MEQCWIDTEFADNVQHIRVPKGQVIHRDGQVPTHVMMLLSGQIKLTKEGSGQRKQTLQMLREGDLFAYRAVIAGDNYNMTATTVSECEIAVVPKEVFLKRLMTDNDLCFRMSVMLAKRLGHNESRTVTLTQKHVRGRLAEALLLLKSQYGVTENGALNIRPSRADLASLSNMLTNNAIRTLSQFAKEGIVDVKGRVITILKETELQQISQNG